MNTRFIYFVMIVVFLLTAFVPYLTYLLKDKEPSGFEISIQSFQLGECIQLKEEYDEWNPRIRFIVTQIGKFSYLLAEYRVMGNEGCDEKYGICNKMLLFEEEKKYNKVNCLGGK